MSLVEGWDLHKIYSSDSLQVRAVDGLDLQIDEGEFLSIVGPSGSGKTTLLHLLGLLDQPTAGQVIVRGRDTSRLNGSDLTRIRRENIGFIFQEFNLLPVLNALENVELPLRYRAMKTAERQKRAMEALDTVGLSQRAGNRPSQLSGGEQQRVAIARALVAKPALVLADEPTGELDSENTCRIIELMRRLNEELHQTFAIVTHDLFVADYTNRKITLRDGKIVSDEWQEGRPLNCDLPFED